MEYKSLYAYLGRGAGAKLGKEVAAKATELGLRLEKVTVEKKLSPSGFVYAYPVDFLDEYFNKELSLEDRVKSLENRVRQLEDRNAPKDDLPF
jgi:hypothetical protein